MSCCQPKYGNQMKGSLCRTADGKFAESVPRCTAVFLFSHTVAYPSRIPSFWVSKDWKIVVKSPFL